jgi:hypothetical protein
MKRIIDHFLMLWKQDPYRKPLLLRGARQVGKTYSVRQFGTTYPHFVEINFELQAKAIRIFEEDLVPARLLRELSLIAQQEIIPGKTLLFLDEVQMAPQAIIALRYFYEMMPELHVIAAGSLLDFAIEQVGVPVGRVQSLYIHPLSFIEYLVAVGDTLLAKEIINQNAQEPLGQVIHEKTLKLLGEYLALGGMPLSVQRWADNKKPLNCAQVHHEILRTYRQDFSKYARKLQIKYVELIFNSIPLQQGRKFKYSLIEGDYRKRELAPALDLLVTAGIAHKVYRSAGQGVPLGAQIDPQDYKIIFLDSGLAQTLLGLDVSQWFLQPQEEFINKGALVETFVGQELIAYTDPASDNSLYYWQKNSGASQAEIDYLIQQVGTVIPIEVKAGQGTTLRSMHSFLENHPKSPFGIRFSTQNYSRIDKIHSYPLYAVAQVMCEKNAEMRQAIERLL